MAQVVTWQNANTRERINVCVAHESKLAGDWSVSHGQHEGTCDYCEGSLEELLSRVEE